MLVKRHVFFVSLENLCTDLAYVSLQMSLKIAVIFYEDTCAQFDKKFFSQSDCLILKR